MRNEIGRISESINVQLADKVRALEQNGRKIVQLQTGDPDFKTPKLVMDAAYASMTAGETHYCASRGIPDLRLAIADKIKRQNNFHVEPGSQILVTHGASHGIFLAISSIVNPQDEVIVVSPYWMPYASDVELAGGTVKILETHIEDQFLPSLQGLKLLIGARTKAIIFNSPNNPTGAVYSSDLLRALGEICIEYGLYIISDEVYEDLSYDIEHVSIQALFPDYKKIISVFSFSKSYAMTGWRLGYLVSSSDVISQVAKLSQYTVTSLSPFVQKAGVVALRSAEVSSEIQGMVREYRDRRAFIVSYLKDTEAEKRIFIPKGAFYLFVDIKGLADSSSEFVWNLINNYGVSFSPGIAFGPAADRYIRMTFAADRKAIKNGLDVLKEVLK